ncbi:MAG: O-antigen ligase family protein [Terricaulis sp.]
MPADLGGPARAAFFALLPAAAVSGGLAIAVLIAAAGAVSFRPSLLRQLIEIRPVAVLALLAFIVWAVVSSAWSPYPDHVQAPKLAATFGLGLVFAWAASRADARRLTRAGCLAAFCVLAALLTVEAIADLALNRAVRPEAPDWVLEGNPTRGAVILLALTWAVAGGLSVWGGRWRLMLAATTLLITAILVGQFHQLANVIGFGLGLCAFALGLVAPRIAPLLVTGAAASWMAAAPFLTPLAFADPRFVETLPYSWAARAGIWDYVCGRIAERPWIGHGLDASRAVHDFIEVQGRATEAVPLHPHSASLQIWFETGLIGVALGAAALVAGGWSLSRAFAQNRAAAAAACGTIAALSFIANVSYGIWQEWWIATMFLAAAAIGAISVKRSWGG